MLRQKGVDLKTAQELLRHANSRITQDIYQQAVSEEKRAAQNRFGFKSVINIRECASSSTRSASRPDSNPSSTWRCTST